LQSGSVHPVASTVDFVTKLEVHDACEPRIAVVIPTYNERACLPQVVAGIAALAIPRLNVLIVDDNSPDGTGVVADKLARDPSNRLSVLHRRCKDGLGRAYVDGIGHALEAGAQVVVQMDADLSHPPSSIPLMLRALHYRGTGVVIGSRYVYGGSVDADWPLRRRWLSRNANRYVNLVLRLGVHDVTSGFKAWRAETLADIDLPSIKSCGYAFQFETTFRAARSGWDLLEVPICFRERRAGHSKMGMDVLTESVLAPWQLRFSGRRATREPLVGVH
jgi:dolichol-phosphate mannosyltransferase